MAGEVLPFDSVLIANRGEISRRITRTVHRLGLRAVAVHSEADAGALHVVEADESVLLGPASPAESYLRGDAVVAAALSTGAQAVHPGYGFLSENAGFARSVIAAGLTWIGPSPAAIDAMGDKIEARNRMSAAGLPVAAGTAEPITDVAAAVAAAGELGFPLMVKASAGGGGIGMGVATDVDSLVAAFQTARSRAERFFGSPSILLERYVQGARHVEVQVLGWQHEGTSMAAALGERDCSVQRRHQKVAEESPSPGVGAPLRERMLSTAVRAVRDVGYTNAGTIECLIDPAAQEFFFLEMNTRLQVEHPVTEAVTGIDLVEQQLRIAGGLPPELPEVFVGGHAIELRVYAEDPVRFLPSPGTITAYSEPAGVRVDGAYRSGDTVTPHYDPMLAKVIVHGADREQALALARRAVADFTLQGIRNNLPFLAELLDDPRFVSGRYDTGLVELMRNPS